MGKERGRCPWEADERGRGWPHQGHKGLQKEEPQTPHYSTNKGELPLLIQELDEFLRWRIPLKVERVQKLKIGESSKYVSLPHHSTPEIHPDNIIWTQQRPCLLLLSWLKETPVSLVYCICCCSKRVLMIFFKEGWLRWVKKTTVRKRNIAYLFQMTLIICLHWLRWLDHFPWMFLFYS